MCFVSLGETPNLEQDVDIVTDIDGGWPLIYDLSQPSSTYNGHYGFIFGNGSVRRSFEVGSVYVPGVAVVVGIAVGLPMFSEVDLVWANGWSGIGIGPQVQYTYQPQLVIKP